MRMLVKFIGTASQYAGRVHVLQPADFQIEGGLNALPTKGDLLLLPVNGRAEPLRFKCTGRHFGFASDDAPVLHIDLEIRLRAIRSAPPSLVVHRVDSLELVEPAH